MKKTPPARRPAKAPPAGRPVMFSLLHAAREIEGRLEKALGTVGLSGAKFMALSKLAEAEEPVSLTELAGRLICVRSNITQLVDRLEADGLVKRVEDPKDRRSVRAALTPLGRERQAAGAGKVAKVQKELDRVFADLDRHELDRAVAKLG